ncbi:hypothetical protein RIVM261_078430 [Rivularia sp. IAM M-261]|nr:hypothetical protein RIVM261_078430 [Rivularia sp. IAM M-261]
MKNFNIFDDFCFKQNLDTLTMLSDFRRKVSQIDISLPQNLITNPLPSLVIEARPSAVVQELVDSMSAVKALPKSINIDPLPSLIKQASQKSSAMQQVVDSLSVARELPKLINIDSESSLMKQVLQKSSAMQQVVDSLSVARELPKLINIDLKPLSLKEVQRQFSDVQGVAQSALMEIKMPRSINIDPLLSPASIMKQIARYSRIDGLPSTVSIMKEIERYSRIDGLPSTVSTMKEIERYSRIDSLPSIASMMKGVSGQLFPSLYPNLHATEVLHLLNQPQAMDLTDDEIITDNNHDNTERKIIVLDGFDETVQFPNHLQKISPDNSIQRLPSWMLKLPEEYRANLIDYREQWYEGKPLIWYTHLEISWRTLMFIVWEIPRSHFLYWLQSLFQPTHRPRL